MGRFYNKEYFSWQSSIGEFGGWANKPKFSSFINKSDRVLDFGCGGGYLLKHIDCFEKLGIDVNPEALTIANENGIQTYLTAHELLSNSVDVIISNHALEHVADPLGTLHELFRILKPLGKIIFVIPCETTRVKFSTTDKNHHLFSWSPMSLANLFSLAGFFIIDSKPFIHKWPPHYRSIAKFGGRKIFDFICMLHARVEVSTSQVRIVAQKPGIHI